jgi:hypothetical protein
MKESMQILGGKKNRTLFGGAFWKYPREKQTERCGFYIKMKSRNN